jgi:hypothetical protein
MATSRSVNETGWVNRGKKDPPDIISPVLKIYSASSESTRLMAKGA